MKTWENMTTVERFAERTRRKKERLQQRSSKKANMIEETKETVEEQDSVGSHAKSIESEESEEDESEENGSSSSDEVSDTNSGSSEASDSDESDSEESSEASHIEEDSENGEVAYSEDESHLDATTTNGDVESIEEDSGFEESALNINAQMDESLAIESIIDEEQQEEDEIDLSCETIENAVDHSIDERSGLIKDENEFENESSSSEKSGSSEEEDESAEASASDDSALLANAILEHAVYLGMDPETDKAYFWIAEKALTADLPADWEQAISEDGAPYHFNTITNETTWSHPRDKEFRDLFQTTKKKDIQQSMSVAPHVPIKPRVLQHQVEIESLDGNSDVESRANDMHEMDLEGQEDDIPQVLKQQPIVVESNQETFSLDDEPNLLEMPNQVDDLGLIYSKQISRSPKKFGTDISSYKILTLKNQIEELKNVIVKLGSDSEIRRNEVDKLRENNQLLKDQLDIAKSSDREQDDTVNALSVAQSQAALLEEKFEESTRHLEAAKNEIIELKIQIKENQRHSKESTSTTIVAVTNANTQLSKVLEQLHVARMEHAAEKTSWLEQKDEFREKLATMDDIVEQLKQSKSQVAQSKATNENISKKLAFLQEQHENLNASLLENKQDEKLIHETTWDQEKASRIKSLHNEFEDRFKLLLREKQDMINNTHEQRNQLKERISSLERENTNLKVELTVVRSENGSSVERLRDEISQLKNELYSLDNLSTGWKNTNATEKCKNENLEKLLQDSTAHTKSLASEIQSLVTASHQQQMEIERLQQQLLLKKVTEKEESNGQHLFSKMANLEGELLRVKSEIRIQADSHEEEMKAAVVQAVQRTTSKWKENTQTQLYQLQSDLALQNSTRNLSLERSRSEIREMELRMEFAQQHAESKRSELCAEIHRLSNINEKLLMLQERYHRSDTNRITSVPEYLGSQLMVLREHCKQVIDMPPLQFNPVSRFQDNMYIPVARCKSSETSYLEDSIGNLTTTHSYSTDSWSKKYGKAMGI